MASKTIHDGERVRARCDALGMTRAALARALAMSESKLYRLLREPNWTTGDLVRAGAALGMDFFAAYVGQVERPAGRMVKGVLVDVEVLRSEAGRLRALEELEE